MKKDIIVAVIDSGVNKDDGLIKDLDICDLYYENKEFKPCRLGRTNIHGTEIIKVLLREAPNIRIISIQTLHEDNRCTLSTIIDSIQYCISIHVDVINLSLGSCTSSAKRLKDLKEVCEEATKKGIAIFAADNNIPNKKSYPANFENIISVTTPNELNTYCQVRFKDKCVEFAENYVFIPDENRCIIRKGNSYLCPMLVGLFCRFMENREINLDNTIEFMEFLKVFSDKDNISRIYFNKNSEIDINYLNNKKICFFADDMDFNNRNIFEFYKDCSKTEWGFNNIYKKSCGEIEAYVRKFDILYVGVLSNQFLNKNVEFINDLIQLLIKIDVDIITILPIINTFDRLIWTKSGENILKSIYK